MAFTPATTEQRFVLDHVVRIGELAATDRFAAASDDVVDAVLEGVGQFAAGEWAPLNRAGDTVGAKWTPDGVVMPDGFAQAYKDYVEGGWGTIGVEEEWGGQGLPFAIQTAVLDTLGSANMGFALCPTLTVGAIEALAHHGSPEQQALYLPHLATGEWTGTMNLTEPQAGSDVGALRATATPLGDGKWSIKGTKIYISFGDHDMAPNIVHLVLARTPGAPAGTKGISLFLVPKYRLNDDGTPGDFNDVRVVSIEHKMGLHASPTCVLSFGDNDDCVGELIGAELGGIRAMFTMMNNARLNVGLQGVQVAEGATQGAVAYALDRVQSARAGSPNKESVKIVEHPDVRRMLLRMKAQTQAARALVYYAAGQVDRANMGDAAARNRLELVTPLAKAHGTDIGNEVASLGIQVHGGMGYVEETGAAQYFRDARITPIYEGTNGIQAADLVGRKLALDNGGAFATLIADIRAEARDERLLALVDACDAIGRRLATADADDKLAASYPFLTMLSVATCGWLMERQGAVAGTDDFGRMKAASVRFYLEQIVPEAMGLAAAASASAAVLYAIEPALFAA
ncbi:MULTISPECIES: acyl-CoA dehydrogenase [unclassified Sphingomonas]|jgi:alkylation response protein AidB-like acyl-CoA dehydrogenase|uniref:acyl-CoA dehydrogenase n=1 Tax=unclassified Sphingomonas TaxID=196159 RepID=UPI0004DF5C01|nr:MULTISPECIES: acyl-CoA dehydrogenase [unclassified Sphingomonas]KHA64203.1 acyl-CoA dehydrogenase [Sphingomonas sp. Ant20]MBD8469913.1 acyl-CoA dehydrogenase [Sphingomonas sp. CFBP 8765]MDY1009278.1 acyl-CoA dehydrogenase [Sphingomonas sp. CFBP9019]